MHVVCNSGMLGEALHKVSRFTASKSHGIKSILECVLLNGHDETLDIAAYHDLSNTYVQLSIPVIAVKEAGSIAVPAHYITPLVNEYPKHASIELKCSNSGELLVTVDEEGSEHSFPIIPSDEFPSILSHMTPKAHFSTSAQMLSRIFKCTAFATSDLFYPVVYITQKEPSYIDFVATDTYRMSLVKLPCDGSDASLPIPISVNGVVISKLISILQNMSGNVIVTATERLARISSESFLCITSNETVEFPDYTRILFQQPLWELTVDTKALMRAVESVKPHLDTYSPFIFLSFTPDKPQTLIVQGKSEDWGYGKTACPVSEYKSEINTSFKVSLNASLILDFLKRVNTRYIQILSQDPNPIIKTPILMQPLDMPDFQWAFYIMPAHLDESENNTS
ncbi:MAG: DNA polymerase III subunit beta [Candidatus Bathyarchaeia archaeon]